MTNAEYFEGNNISFSDSMKLFNKSNFNSFDEFLNSKYKEHKFKEDDIVVLQLNECTRDRGWKNNVVFLIIKCRDEYYEVKYLTPTESNCIGDYRELPTRFIDENCKIY